MLTLAFDTSAKTASVAVLEDDIVVYDVMINAGKNHSEVLLPAIGQACAGSGVHIRQIDLFACTLGPGSFTGLRIGLSTLKGLMMATGKPGAGVSSLHALALNARHCTGTVAAMMDAGRGQLYLAYFRSDEDGFLHPLGPEAATAPQNIADCPYEEVVYVGDGAVKYAAVINSSIGRNQLVFAENQFIGAWAVGLLAVEKYRSRDLLDIQKATPVYLRPADAEPGKPVFPSQAV
jgi:tRNA threonylcarbamoyladenosine biosynthesis protein TsaB